MKHMKAVLLYIALVALPLLGILGILQLGDGLNAPPDLAGRWTLRAVSAPELEQGCTLLPLEADSLSMHISQSGQYLRLRFEGAEETVLRGTWRDGVLVVEHEITAGASAEGACDEATTATLRARLDQEAGRAKLRGVWTTSCDACPELNFQAVRVDPANSTG